MFTTIVTIMRVLAPQVVKYLLGKAAAVSSGLLNFTLFRVEKHYHYYKEPIYEG